MLYLHYLTMYLHSKLSLTNIMLKLTNSCCRYLWLASENLNPKVHSEKYTYIHRRKSFSCNSFRNSTNSNPLLKCDLELCLTSSCKRQLHSTKCQHLSNDSKTKFKQMSEQPQPSPTHVSHGGQFQINTAEDAKPSTDQYKKKSESPGKGSKRNESSFLRVWETVNKSDNIDKSFKFKIVSYNVLAQYLLEFHPYLYTDCWHSDLKWNNRAPRLYGEILSLAPDIFCLQEVQMSHVCTFYKNFEKLGYYSVIKQKTGNRDDGCAIYFKKSSFILLDHISVEYYQPELPILNRDNIGLLVKLAPACAPECEFVVATTHLLFNPRRNDVRLAQLQVLLAEIDRFAYQSNGNKSGYMPIILTGDFNSKLDSVIVKLLNRGRVSAHAYRDSSDWQRIQITDNCQHLSVFRNRQQRSRDPNVYIKLYNSDYCAAVPDGSYRDEGYGGLFNGTSVRHSLGLSPVYEGIKPDGQYEATTYQDEWVTVDYIYYSNMHNLKLLERLRLPTAKECEALGPLPNADLPSDHLALGAVFEMRHVKSPL